MASVDAPGSPPTEAKSGGTKTPVSKKKFELKKWNAVALWAWGM
jgi:hypothetical protein